MSTLNKPIPSIWDAWLRYAKNNPPVTLGLGASALIVVWFVITSLYQAFAGDGHIYIGYAWRGGLAAFGATALGAVSIVVLRGITDRTQDTMLGFAAGMMLSASSFSLILPGLDAGTKLFGNAPLGALTVVIGLALGVLLMLGLDYFTPHEHENAGACGPNNERIGRIWLFVLAIILHNFPEGMAIGVGFSHGDMSVGLPLTTAIAIQDIPEGLAVAMALRAVGLSMRPAILIAVASGLMEPLGALVGVGMSSGFPGAYPVSLGLAAGAMIFVVSHEVIPETHRNGHQTAATIGLMAGFATMMFLDTAL